MSGSQLAAEILERNAAAFARQTCLRLENHLAQEAIGIGDSADAWHADTMQRISELAVALRLGQPEFFVEKTLWLARAYAARDFGVDSPRNALLSLRESLVQDFPKHAIAAVLEVLDQALSALQGPLEPIDSALKSGGAFDKLALRYIATCIEGRSDEAIALVVDEIRNGLAADEVVCRVIVPAQREIGNMWHGNEASIAQEHLLTNTTTELLAVIGSEFAKPANPDLRVLLASVSGNAHDIGIRAAATVLRLAGWRSICLGTDLPPNEIAAAAEDFDVSLVVLSATIATHISAVTRTIEAINGLPGKVPVIVGGQPFDTSADLWKQVGADAMTAGIDHLVETASALQRTKAI